MASLRDTSNGLMGGPAVPGVPPGMPGPPSFMINPLAGGPKKKKKQPKTRRLFWEKIDTSGAGGALWEEVVDMDAFVDRKEVEQLFGRGGAKKSKSKKSKGGGKKGKEEKEKDEKQESVFGDELRQMEICFRGLRQIGCVCRDSSPLLALHVLGVPTNQLNVICFWQVSDGRQRCRSARQY